MNSDDLRQVLQSANTAYRHHMNQSIPHEARLWLTSEMPVRCEGYIEDRAFHAETVWIDGVVLGAPSTCHSFDIIDSLRAEVIERLEDEANDQIDAQLTRD